MADGTACGESLDMMNVLSGTRVCHQDLTSLSVYWYGSLVPNISSRLVMAIYLSWTFVLAVCQCTWTVNPIHLFMAGFWLGRPGHGPWKLRGRVYCLHHTFGGVGRYSSFVPPQAKSGQMQPLAFLFRIASPGE